jgi:glycosyltransferase involved in cell wall biosynthesis
VVAPVNPLPDYFGPGGPVVLFLGQKYAYKGLKQMLLAMPLVWAKYPQVRFAFLGPRTPDSQKMFRAIRDPRVIEKDRVPEAEKQSALAQCAVFCLPSRQESFGSVFTEAWMFGKPVIGGNIPALAELISDGVDGSLVGESPQALAQAVLALLQDPEKARRMGEAGRKKVSEKYTWDAVVKSVEGVYTQLLNR